MARNDAASLIEAHLDLARKAARMIYPRVKEHLEFEELVAMGQEGLVEAAARFDPAGGASFKTFAWYRVYGSIMDGLRRASNLPRRTWAKLCALRAAADYLETQGEKTAGARAAGAPVPSTAEALRGLRDAMSAIQTMYVTSLATVIDTHEEPADDAPEAGETIDRRRMAARVAKAIAELPERERALVQKHYWEGKNLLEAGVELGISKSWACRVHASAVGHIRDALARDDDP
ncbi:MAG: sigma-70 family RNA polymerase sigma factor [Deltaproteobacteria bacterium]|nr:sigma-70 family RNA polymerase sigma factor [Deltaproteobacteria bacterium]